MSLCFNCCRLTSLPQPGKKATLFENQCVKERFGTELKEFAYEFISNYGLAGLYLYFVVDTLGVFLPSKTILTLIGVLVGKGALDFGPVVATAMSGSLTGVTISYSIGRKYGKPAAERYGRYLRITPERLARAESWFARYGAGFIVFAYFVPGLRHITPYLAGISLLPYWKTLVFSAIGAFLWVFTFVYLGRFFAANWRAIYETVGPGVWPALVLAALALFFIKRRFRS